MIRCTASLFALLFLVVALLSCTIEAARADDPPPPTPPIKLTIHPMAAPRPSLRYQLLPEFGRRVDGNAAVYYGKVTAEHIGVFGNRELIEKIDNWRELPLADLRKDDIEMPTQSIETMLDWAARCEHCDWQLPVREQNYFEMPLAEAQQTRQFARILGARARIHIARREYGDAIKCFQSALALGRNVAEGETLVNGLIGIAVCGVTVGQLQTFVEQPDAPNLYWALTMLPRPMIDMRRAVEAEMYGATTLFPEVRDLDAQRSPDEWRQVLSRFWRRQAKYAKEANQDAGSADELLEASLRDYPNAKQALLDRGMAAEKVDAMPAAQAVFVDMVTTLEDHRDALFEWMFVPYPDGIDRMLAVQAEIMNGEQRNPARLLEKLLVPAVAAAYAANHRLDREFALLRIVEALRIYGASHNGRLPEKLSDVTEVPIPDDPISGKPFEYHLQDAIAAITLTPLPGRPTKWEIKMER
jgi:hypothetical protein